MTRKILISAVALLLPVAIAAQQIATQQGAPTDKAADEVG